MTADPIEAEKWITKLAEILNVPGCYNNNKVSLTSFLLQGDADLWWKMTKMTCESTAGEIRVTSITS